MGLSLEQSLYQRLGGREVIDRIVTDVSYRLVHHPQLHVFWDGRPADALEHERILLADFMCQVTGGPACYAGRSMRLAHQGLGISGSDMERFLAQWQEVLDAAGVPEREKGEVLSFLKGLGKEVIEKGAAMDTRQVIDAYYSSVNDGDWDTWLTLFHENVVIDEQLAGHVEGLNVLRDAVGVLKRGYSKFTNRPVRIVVDGDEACVVSHIDAANASGIPIQADVANYFQIKDGKITYMANFHDSVPFAPFVNQKLDEQAA